MTSPAALVCCVRQAAAPPGDGSGEADAYEGDLVLRVSSAFAAEPLLEMHAALDSTVGDVKGALQRFRGIPVREQRLLVGDRRICDDVDVAAGDWERQEWIPGNQMRLKDALGPAAASRGAAVDLQLVRVAPDWAALQEGLSEGALTLQSLDSAGRADRALVLTAVSRDGNQLSLASAEARADREVVVAAVRRDPLALRFAADSLRDERELVIGVVEVCGQALQYASARLRSDPEVVLSAMGSAWRAMAFASEELRGDRNFVLAAVRQHGSALLYASDKLKSDYEVVFAAVKNSGWALSCASETLRSDRECVFAAVSANPGALDFAAEPLRSDPDIRRLADRAGGRRDGSTPCSIDAPPCPLL